MSGRNGGGGGGGWGKWKRGVANEHADLQMIKLLGWKNRSQSFQPVRVNNRLKRSKRKKEKRE